MKIINTSLTLAALGVLAIFSGCSSDGDKKIASEETQKPLVKIQKVGSQIVDRNGNYTATVQADLVNNISSQAPNRIKEIYVDEGDRVSKGQRLAVLDDVNTTSYQLQVDNAKANLANVEINYQRALELFNIGGGTKQQVDQMEMQLINARNALSAAERTLKNATENTVLTSPISGMITARNYDPGDMTGALPILTVSTINPVKVVVNVTESDLSAVRKGMPADITFETYGDEHFTGTVTMVSPTVDAASRTFGVEITVPNNDGRILPGMFARVSMKLGEADHVVVPDMAVVKQPGSGNHYVYVYNDGKVSYNKVELGQRLGDTYELISGVEPGSEVVTTGQSRLANGMEVEILKEEK